jgi:hypothetical protein
MTAGQFVDARAIDGRIEDEVEVVGINRGDALACRRAGAVKGEYDLSERALGAYTRAQAIADQRLRPQGSENQPVYGMCFGWLPSPLEEQTRVLTDRV